MGTWDIGEWINYQIVIVIVNGASAIVDTICFRYLVNLILGTCHSYQTRMELYSEGEREGERTVNRKSFADCYYSHLLGTP